MSRYNKTKILSNSSEYYEPLRKSRNLKSVNHFATTMLHNLTAAERAGLQRTAHTWKYGDRLYKLAHQYYGDERLWWVLAWYNGYPTEAHIPLGNTLYIPLNIEKVLKLLGV
jgi:nucleoid-associated protein YgaU